MTRAKGVKELTKLADERKDPALQHVAEWLRDVCSRLEKVDSGSVTSAIAFGTSLERVDQRPRRERARWGGEHYVEVLVATPSESTFQLQRKLAEQVFGPVFRKYGHLPSYHVWSLDRVAVEREANSPFWRSLERHGVLLTGKPLW